MEPSGGPRLKGDNFTYFLQKRKFHMKSLGKIQQYSKMRIYLNIDRKSVWLFHILEIFLCSHEQLYIHICMQKHIQHNKEERKHFCRKIYLSLYWKGCVWEGVGDRTKTATYWPPNSSGYHSLFFPFSWAAQPAAWGPSLCWDIVLIPASSL